MGHKGRLTHECLAKTVATYILVFFGVGSVHQPCSPAAQSGVWQVAVVWAGAISLAIYATGSACRAHMNPAMTLAFCAWRGFPRKKYYLISSLS